MSSSSKSLAALPDLENKQDTEVSLDSKKEETERHLEEGNPEHKCWKSCVSLIQCKCY